MIAERHLTINRLGQHISFDVRIFIPVEQNGAWSCRYEIAWPNHPRVSEVYGIDSMQALLHAMQAIGSELYTSDEHVQGLLRWTGEIGGYGFPVPRIVRDLLKDHDAEYL